MRRSVLVVSFVAVAVLGLLAPAARAAEGRTPVFLDGTVIAAEGRYILTRNIASGGGGVPVIDIAATKVDLDLNGFTISGAPGAPAILISAPPAEVRIHDGTIDGGDRSIWRPAGPLGRLVIIEDVRSHDALSNAIHIQDTENVAIRRNNVIDTAGGGGIVVDSPGGNLVHGEITHNAIKRVKGNGIHVYLGFAVEIGHNQIELAGAGTPGAGNGIFLEDSVGCLLLENVVSRAASDGLLLRNSQGNKLFDNVVRMAFDNGIRVDLGSADNHIYRNVATNCGLFTGVGSGILVEGARNDLNNNTSNSNAGCGLRFVGPANVLRANTALGNGVIAGACPPPAACAPMFSPNSCDATGGANPSGEPFAPNNMIAAPF